LRLEEKWDFPHRLRRIGSDAGSPTGGSRTHEFSEDQCEMALVRKAQTLSNLGNPQFISLEQGLGVFNSSPKYVLMWRQTCALFERAREMEQTHSGYIGEFLKAIIFPKVRLDVVNNLPQPIFREAAPVRDSFRWKDRIFPKHMGRQGHTKGLTVHAAGRTARFRLRFEEGYKSSNLLIFNGEQRLKLNMLAWY
jgi:hypothetical protein